MKLGIAVATGGVFIVDSEDAGFVAVECQRLTVALQISPGGFKIGERGLRTDEEKLHLVRDGHLNLAATIFVKAHWLSLYSARGLPCFSR